MRRSGSTSNTGMCSLSTFQAGAQMCFSQWIITLVHNLIYMLSVQTHNTCTRSHSFLSWTCHTHILFHACAGAMLKKIMNMLYKVESLHSVVYTLDYACNKYVMT